MLHYPSPSCRSCRLQKDRRRHDRPDPRLPLNIIRIMFPSRRPYFTESTNPPPSAPRGGPEPLCSAGAGFALQGRARAPAPAPHFPPIPPGGFLPPAPRWGVLTALRAKSSKDPPRLPRKWPEAGPFVRPRLWRSGPSAPPRGAPRPGGAGRPPPRSGRFAPRPRRCSASLHLYQCHGRTQN